MDCQHARLLTHFVRPGEPLLEPAEMGAFNEHLAACPECRQLAQTQRRADEKIARTVRDVKAPAGLRERIVTRLTYERRPSRRMVLSLAASVLLLIGGGLTWTLWPAPQLDLLALVENKAGSSPERVQAWFADQGLNITLPQKFNYEHLDDYAVVLLQGQPVAKLTFRLRSMGSMSGAVAHVHVVPANWFTIDKDQSHGVVVEAAGESNNLFLITHSGGALEPFYLSGI